MEHTSGAPARRGSRLIVVGAIGLVLFLLAGVGGYVVMSDARREDLSYCGHDCVPGLKITTVVEALKGRGHSCADERLFWSCDLRVGDVRFEAVLYRPAAALNVYDYISKVKLKIRNPDGNTSVGADVGYMSWFATMPHRDDPTTVKKVNDWLAEGVRAEKDVTYVLGWEYVLQRNAQSIDLTMKRRY
ncbi:hypothetical protein SAMN05660976_05828 [Nonomuraea pusilla]|uniref:Uncharacterized protein n=1 Tax=Nonomuraea pusilla TaxID=46177 RepID=A0A1H8AIF3_9ACTN|nr:hypothetical protein SAMN05660976_05828 [Nonomuraea pusilla]